MADMDYRIHETLCELDILEMYCWLEDKWIDKLDEIQLWESNLLCYIFPPTYNTPDFIRKFHASYFPSQRVITNSNGNFLFTITPQAIDQMILAPTFNNGTPFSHEAIVEIYQKLDLAKRTQTLELFLAQDASFPKKNPPYPSSLFPKRTKNITTIISYHFGY